MSIVPGFFLKGVIHKAQGGLLEKHVIFVMLVGVHTFH